MLFLHCGWPRTGTSTFQAALFEQRDLLARAGISYPDRWLDEKGFGHHSLNALIDQAVDAGKGFDEFEQFLKGHSGGNVLFSAESLTVRLDMKERLEGLLSFIAAAREIMPVRCLWTLRRVDELVASGYLMMLRLGWGAKLPSPVDRIGGSGKRFPVPSFEGMRRVEEVAGTDAVYVKYDAKGQHNRELLATLDLEHSVKEALEETLESAPHRNVSPTHKEAVVLANLDALSLAGVELNAPEVSRTIRSTGFCFEEDWPCELVERSVKVDLHRRMLAAAKAQGAWPYLEFFADEEIGMSSPVVGLSPEILTDEDWERLLAHIRPLAPL